MKRFLGMAMAAGVLLGLIPFNQAQAARPCGDIVNGVAGYTTNGGFTPATVEAIMTFKAASCAEFTYSMVVLSDDGPLASELGRVDQPGNGSTEIGFQLPLEEADGGVCVYGIVSASNGRVIDRGPDVGCDTETLDVDDGGGSSGWR